MKKVIVYDFDKTLTYKDTLVGFFLYSAKKDISYPFKVIIYLLGMILSKLQIIKNTQLKTLGIKLFLSKLEQKTLLRKYSTYKNKIKFNKIYKTMTFTEENDYFVVSASFEEYLSAMFPKNVNIIASKMEYVDGVPVGIKINCYKENKILALNQWGIKTIDILYTDSYSDYTLAKISEKIIIINGDKETVCHDIDEFKRYFQK